MAQAILAQKGEANERIFEILFESDEVSWKQLIFGLIEAEQMDPWDINISKLAQKFLEMLKKLKEMDFRITGKVVLASAILLKMKSTRLMEEDIAALDNLINSVEEPVDLGLFEEMPIDGALLNEKPLREKPQLVPRTPQPRKRKVSVYDLVEALEQALKVEARRPPRASVAPIVEAPKNTVDLGAVMQDVYDRVNTHYKQGGERLTFDALCPSEQKEDKVFTFIPLLHLDFQRKVDVAQKQHFGTINVDLLARDATFTQAELE